jgi:hypothetical protein
MSDTARLQEADTSRMEEAVHRYLALNKKWRRDDYRLEERGLTPDKQHAVFWAVFLQDETRPAPGGGKSLVLHVDPQRNAVVKELRFQ